MATATPTAAAKAAAPIPKLLTTLSKRIRSRINPEIIDGDTWVLHDQLEAFVLARKVNKPWSNKHGVELLQRSVELLKMIYNDPSPAKQWKNTHACPKTAIGDYIWTFQLSVVQELLWLRPEFVAGFNTGLNLDRDDPHQRGRDINPYKDYNRNQAWGSGYILGLAQFHKEPKVKQWLRWLDDLEPSPQRPYLEVLLEAAQRCTGEDTPGNWEWKGRDHLDGKCNCNRKK